MRIEFSYGAFDCRHVDDSIRVFFYKPNGISRAIPHFTIRNVSEWQYYTFSTGFVISLSDSRTHRAFVFHKRHVYALCRQIVDCFSCTTGSPTWLFTPCSVYWFQDKSISVVQDGCFKARNKNMVLLDDTLYCFDTEITPLFKVPVKNMQNYAVCFPYVVCSRPQCITVCSAEKQYTVQFSRTILPQEAFCVHTNTHDFIFFGKTYSDKSLISTKYYLQISHDMKAELKLVPSSSSMDRIQDVFCVEKRNEIHFFFVSYYKHTITMMKMQNDEFCMFKCIVPFRGRLYVAAGTLCEDGHILSDVGRVKYEFIIRDESLYKSGDQYYVLNTPAMCPDCMQKKLGFWMCGSGHAMCQNCAWRRDWKCFLCE